MNKEKLEEIVIRKYLNNEDYVVRIEKEKKKENGKIKYQKDFVVKVYYQGIQSFMVKKNELTLNVAMFTLKGNKPFTPVHDDKIEYLKDKGFHFQIGFNSSGDLRNETHKKYYLKIKPSKNIELYKNNQNIQNEMKEILKKVKDYKTDAIHKEIDNINYFLFDNNDIEYNDLIKLTAKLIRKIEGVQKIECNEKIVSPKNINEEDLQKLDKIINEKQEEYNKADTKSSDTKLYGEKMFQQNLMVKMNKAKTGKDISILNKEPFNKNTHAFLMEYNFYEASYIEKTRQSKKGRVDNLFIKDNKILFVELKYDENVIGGSHGIHRHLIDIYNSSKKNKQFREEIYEDVKIYNEGLKEYIQDYQKYQIDIKKDGFDKDIEFVIICGYSNGNKEKVIEEINRVKNMTFKDFVESKEVTYDEYKKEKKALGKNDEKLLNMKVTELIEEMEHIDNKFKCDVNIYLSDENFTNIEKVSL